MTVSMRVMSAGDGYRYLLRTVAAGDGARPLSTPLTRYYTEEGTPPGRWMGAGVASLASDIRIGDTVTEAQLQLLIGMGRHPVSGEALGRAYPQYGPDTKADGSASHQRAVAGYDFTFSIPKSASVLWGIADARTQALVVDAHHRAVAHVVAYLEREVAATRTGATASDGAVAQVSVKGIIATAFDHFDSRAGDPHLHTHVVVSNKVQTVLDDKWRSLDGRPLHAAAVALSELHEAIFTDELTVALGVGWEARDRGRDRNRTWAITGIPRELVAHFSSRSHAIDDETDKLIDAFVTAHGHRPTPATIMKLRARATLSTRPEKQLHSLADLTAGWRQRATALLGQEATSWAGALTSRPHRIAPIRATDLSPSAIADLGEAVVTAVAEKRTTWRRWNLIAEAARQTMPLRFVSASDRERAVDLVADAAENASLRLTPPEIAESPLQFQRADGSSVFRARRSAVFTANLLLEAESRLIERSRITTAPRLSTPAFARHRGKALSPDQVVALGKIAGSGRSVDLLVGAAGTGKTSAMRALRDAWERTYGRGSVVGLAPSAGAAHVLAEDLGIPTENTAKWWTNHLARGERFSPGQLVIIDEASLAGTLSLDRISSLAADAGAKVLLVGDHAQLQAVEAGGAFALLAHDRDDVPELVDVHRFVHAWEKKASVELRDGSADVIDEYADHHRVVEGESDAMIDAAYVAWRKDVGAGRASVLVADSNEAVTALNIRARAERILGGDIFGTTEVILHAGTSAAAGDIILTRRNDRTLRTGRSWVRNGDRWSVIDVLKDGRMLVRRADRHSGATVTLPAVYVAEHVDLGYAITAHRAQGITMDTAHVLVQAGMTRESLYVAMTRGRRANTAYVAVDRPEVSHSGRHPGDHHDATGASVLRGVVRHVGAELSAHETMTAEQDRWGSIAQLAAEYETIAAAAQHDRWVALVRGSGLSTIVALGVIGSDAFGPLTAALRRAEAHHHDVDVLFRAVVTARALDDADDVAAVLQSRIERAMSEKDARQIGRKVPQLAVGLIPEALGPMTPEMRRSLEERRTFMENRAHALAEKALEANDSWTNELGPEPTGSAQAAWRRHARTVAAYRDRYGITGSSALGYAPTTSAKERDYACARGALESAARLARADRNESLRSQRSAPERSAPVR